MKCWNDGCDTDIIKAENWSPQNKCWIETASERPHNFKECFRKSLTKSGKWHSPLGKYKPTGDPIIDNCNKFYYKDLFYFLTHGPPTKGYYDLSWLEKK